MDLPFETGDGEGGEGGTLASTVLVVDDEPVVLDICARLLEREPDASVPPTRNPANPPFANKVL